MSMFIISSWPSLQGWSWNWLTLLIVAGLITLPFLFTYIVTSIQSTLQIKNKTEGVEPPQAPYFIPLPRKLTIFPPKSHVLCATPNVRLVTNPPNAIPLISPSTKFNSTPVRLKFGPDSYGYFVSSAPNIQSLFSSSRDLSTKDWMIWAWVQVFGMPPSDASAHAADDSGISQKPASESEVAPEDRLFYLSHHNFSANLKGAGLAELSRQFTKALAAQIVEMGEELQEGEWCVVEDLFEYMLSKTFRAASMALYGPRLPDESPGLASDFWEFESWLPAIFKNLPEWMIGRAYVVRDKMIKRISMWQERADDMFDWGDEKMAAVGWEECFGARVVRSSWEMWKRTNWKVSWEGKAAYDLAFMWAANANSLPAAAWTLMHIIADPALLGRIQAETASAFSGGVESADVIKLSRCPLLQSVVAEVLRLRVAVMVNRMSVVPDFKIGGRTLEPGRIILGSTYFAHRDENIWNTGHTQDDGTLEHPLDEFWAERFLAYPDDPFSGPLKPKTPSPPVPSNTHQPNTTTKRPDTRREPLRDVFPFGGGVKAVSWANSSRIRRFI